MGKRLRALFIEDEPDIRFVVELALQHRARFSLTSFDDGLSALSFLAGKENNFDVALIDVQLPSMSGIQFARRLRMLPRFVKLPIIFVTALLIDTDAIDFDSVGALGVISKPFEAITLADRIEELLDTKRSIGDG